MRVIHARPSAALAPFVERLTMVETEHEATRVLLPDPGLIVGARYAGSASELGQPPVPDASLAGLRARARTMQTSAGGGVVLATFRPAMAAAFFGEPLHELFGATTALDELVPPAAVRELLDHVAAAGDPSARFAALERFLLARRPAAQRDPLVDRAARAIVAARGAIHAGNLARETGLSRDRFEKRFRRVVGTSPKRLATIVRLREAVAAYRPGTTMADLAAEAGYFDQAHFTRELRAFTGSPPRRFFERAAHC